MSMAAGISTYRGTPCDGGRDIRPTAEEVRAYRYGLVVAWGNAHGLPSDVDYAARLDAAYPPSGERGRPAGMSVERLRFADTARAWRTQGWDERTIALAAAWGIKDSLSKIADELRSKRLKRLESDLRKLEVIEGAQSPPRPERDEIKRRAASIAVAARDRAREEMSRCLQRAHRAGRMLDDDPAYLRVRAEHLRRTVKARNALDLAGIPRTRGPRDAAERREMRALAYREERRATKLQRESETEGLSSSDLAAMRRQQYEERLAGYDLEPLFEPPTDSRRIDASLASNRQKARREQLGGGRRNRVR